MKKFICMALILVLAFTALTACSERKPVDAVVPPDSNDNNGGGDGSTDGTTPVVKEPTRITTVVNYVFNKDTLTSEYVTSIDKANKRASFYYSSQRYPTLDEAAAMGGDYTRIITESGTVYYDMAANLMTVVGSNKWTSATSSAPQFKLSVAPESYISFVKNDAGNEVTATLDPSKTVEVLGYQIDTLDDEPINVTIKTINGDLDYFEMSYTTTGGHAVKIRTSYTYADVTVDEIPMN